MHGKRHSGLYPLRQKMLKLSQKNTPQYVGYWGASIKLNATIKTIDFDRVFKVSSFSISNVKTPYNLIKPHFGG